MKHKRAISWLLVVALMASNMVIMPASAANYVLDTPAVTAPDFDEATFNSKKQAFVANYDEFIDPTENLKLNWEDVGAKKYEIWVKGLDGLPNPGDNESGKIICHEKTSKTSMTIDSDDLEDWAGHFIKVALQAQDGDDLSYMGWYYLELDEIREAESYTVKYKKNGGDYAPGSDSTDEDGWFTVSSKTPTRDGYEFLGWSIYKNTDEAEYEPGKDYQIDEDITLYAVWEKETAQQTKPVLEDFDSDEIRIQVNEKITLTGTISAGGSSGAKLNKVTVKHNKTDTKYYPVSANVNAASFDLSRLSFGRFTEPGEYEMVLYASATNYTVKENDIATFTVIVEEKTTKYSITYNANGGKSVPASDTTDKNGWFIVSGDEPTRDGYNFLGWTDGRNNSEIKFVPDEEYQISKNTTLYAVWEKKSTQQAKPILEDFDNDEIRIQVNEKITLTGTIFAGGSSGAKLNKVTVKHNKTGTTYSPVSANVNAASYDLSRLSFGRFTKPGEYEMVLYASATNYTVKENDIVTFTVIVEEKPTKYSITYNANGGKSAPTSDTTDKNGWFIVSENEPTRDGYDFLGWTDSRSSSEIKYVPDEEYQINKNVTLYAVWEKETAQQIKPVLKDFDSDEIRIQVNEKITLAGTISAGGSSGAKLNKVTVKHNKTGTTYSPVSANVNAASYDLSKLSFGRFTKPGEYEMVLYASATNYTVKENDIVTFTVIVSGKEYDVEYDENGGIGAPESQIKQAGTDLILSKEKPTRPDYQFQGWATSKNGKVKYQPGDTYSEDKALTLYAVWEKLPTSPYNDIDGHWGYLYICDVTDLELMDGISSTTFKPNDPMTREMFANALGRLSRVNENLESWLKVNNIMSGYGDGSMGWNDPITREQMAVMLKGYLTAEHITVGNKSTSSYSDNGAISEWANKAVYEVQKTGLMTGTVGNRFNPQGKTTRAEGAVIISNLAKLFYSGCDHRLVPAATPVNNSGKWRDNGNGTHTRYEVNYDRACQYCGKAGSVLPVTDNPVTQNHKYSNGTSSTTYRYVDSSYHQMVSITTKTCWVCSAKKNTEVVSEHLAAHVYDSATGKCLADGCSSVIPFSSAETFELWYRFDNGPSQLAQGVVEVNAAQTKHLVFWGKTTDIWAQPNTNTRYRFETVGEADVLMLEPHGYEAKVGREGRVIVNLWDDVTNTIIGTVTVLVSQPKLPVFEKPSSEVRISYQHIGDRTNPVRVVKETAQKISTDAQYFAKAAKAAFQMVEETLKTIPENYAKLIAQEFWDNYYSHQQYLLNEKFGINTYGANEKEMLESITADLDQLKDNLLRVTEPSSNIFYSSDGGGIVVDISNTKYIQITEVDIDGRKVYPWNKNSEYSFKVSGDSGVISLDKKEDRFLIEGGSGKSNIELYEWDRKIASFTVTAVNFGYNITNSVEMSQVLNYLGTSAPRCLFDNCSLAAAKWAWWVTITEYNQVPEVFNAVGFRQDDNGVYHTSVDCWQQYCGYTDLYDMAFNIGTDMERIKFPFRYKGDEYIFWGWKGDYLNLGAGAELGIYIRKADAISSFYDVDLSKSMPMSMKVMYKGKTIIEWAPTEYQWWITGFNPKYYDVDVSDLTAVYSITFEDEAFYNAFNEQWKYFANKDKYTIKVVENTKSHTKIEIWF